MSSGDKAPITIAVERAATGRLGRVRLEVADRPGGLDIIEFAGQVIAPRSTVHTDAVAVHAELGVIPIWWRIVFW